MYVEKVAFLAMPQCSYNAMTGPRLVMHGFSWCLDILRNTKEFSRSIFGPLAAQHKWNGEYRCRVCFVVSPYSF